MASTVIDKAKSALGLKEGSTDLKITGQPIGSTGFGLMGFTWRANPPPQDQAFAAMRESLKHGANFWNGGEIYGNASRNSLHLLKEYFEQYPEDKEKVVVSIKGGCEKDTVKPNGGVENTRRSIDECISILGSVGKKLDLWESARVDPQTPIEITMRTAKEYVDAGKLGGISLSECSADTIRRAAKVAKIDAVEVEFSLWETEITKNGVADACAELGIPIVAYSPLGRGFLTGQIRSPDDIPEDDLRKHVPRFQGENFQINMKLVRDLEDLAQKKGVTPGQVAVAWIKAKSGKNGMPVLIPIPGATTPARVDENCVDVDLSEADVKEIDALLEKAEVKGGRYPEALAGLNFGSSPPLQE